jgi:hypothetical protein
VRQEAEIRRILVPGKPWQKTKQKNVCETSSHQKKAVHVTHTCLLNDSRKCKDAGPS